MDVLAALRRIQLATDHKERPLARACGLTEEMFQKLADEQLIEVTHFQDEGDCLDIHHIERILPKGHAILVSAPIEPSKVILEPMKRSLWLRMFRVLGTGLWDLIKLAIAAGLGVLGGWFLAKHHWK